MSLQCAPSNFLMRLTKVAGLANTVSLEQTGVWLNKVWLFILGTLSHPRSKVKHLQYNFHCPHTDHVYCFICALANLKFSFFFFLFYLFVCFFFTIFYNVWDVCLLSFTKTEKRGACLRLCEVILRRKSTLVWQGLTSRFPLKAGACNRDGERDFPHSWGVHRLDQVRDVSNKGPEFVRKFHFLHLTLSCYNKCVALLRLCFVARRWGRRWDVRWVFRKVNTPLSWSKCSQCQLTGLDLSLERRRPDLLLAPTAESGFTGWLWGKGQRQYCVIEMLEGCFFFVFFSPFHFNQCKILLLLVATVFCDNQLHGVFFFNFQSLCHIKNFPLANNYCCWAFWQATCITFNKCSQ